MRPGEILTLLGFLTGGLVFFLAARERRLATPGMWWVLLAALAGGVLGAKLGRWSVEGGVLLAQPLLLLDPRSGGRTILGGILGGWLAVELAKRRLGLRRSTGDLFALALPAGEAIGRWGCFLNGCCHGAQTSLPWAVHQHGAWRHPAQIYASLYAALLFVLFLYLRRRLSREGDLFLLYLGLYGAGRFALETVRADRLGPGPLSTGQWISLGLLALSAALWWRRRGGEDHAREQETPT